MLTNRDLGDEPAPTWPTPVAWEDAKPNVDYYIVATYKGSHLRVSGVRLAHYREVSKDAFDLDPQGRPMIYATRKDAAAAMQILLQEWVRG